MSSLPSNLSYLLILLVPLPVGTDRRRRRVPWVTWTLIALNVLVFVGTQSYQHAHPGVDLYGRYGFQPATPNLGNLFCSLFLHVSFGHLFWNMAFLWLFGPHVEDALGPVSFLALYLGGGLAAGVMHTAIKWLVPSQRATLLEPLVGASGAISAIVAPFAVRYHRAQVRLVWLPGLLARSDWGQLEVPALWGLGLWLVENFSLAIRSLVVPTAGGTAYWAHMGGFAFGLIASELGGLLQEGRQEYLLQEARAAAAQGRDRLRVATDKYHAFLDHEPGNVAVRLELARTLAGSSPAEAGAELLAGLRLAQKKQRWPDAVALYAEAETLGLAPALTARERLRLSAAAEETGRRDVAVSLLRRLTTETPDAPEDEMARLRLGQFLRDTEPEEARAVVASFLERYPDSAWADRVRALLRQSAPSTEENRSP